MAVFFEIDTHGPGFYEFTADVRRWLSDKGDGLAVLMVQHTSASLLVQENADPDVQSDRLDLAGEVPSLLNVPGGCEFHTRCPFVQTDCRKSVPVSQEAAPGHVFQCHYPLKEAVL